MSNINELREKVSQYAKAFRVFKDAEEFLRGLEEMQGTEKGMQDAIDKLNKEYEMLVERNNGIAALYEEAKEKARAIVKAGEDNAKSYQGIVEQAREEQNKKLDQYEEEIKAINDVISAKQKELSDVCGEIKTRQEELEALDKLKLQAKIALGI